MKKRMAAEKMRMGQKKGNIYLFYTCNFCDCLYRRRFQVRARQLEYKQMNPQAECFPNKIFLDFLFLLLRVFLIKTKNLLYKSFLQ